MTPRSRLQLGELWRHVPSGAIGEIIGLDFDPKSANMTIATLHAYAGYRNPYSPFEVRRDRIAGVTKLHNGAGSVNVHYDPGPRYPVDLRLFEYQLREDWYCEGRVASRETMNPCISVESSSSSAPSSLASVPSRWRRLRVAARLRATVRRCWPSASSSSASASSSDTPPSADPGSA